MNIPARVRLALQVTPNASRSEIAGIQQGVVRVRLQAPPVEGRANEALVRFLAEALDLPRGAIVVASGHASRRKIVEIAGSNATAEALLARLCAPDSVQSR